METRLRCFILQSLTVWTMCIHLARGLGQIHDRGRPAVLPHGSNGYGYNVSVQPPEISQLTVNTQRQVYIICSSILPPLGNTTSTNLTYMASIVSEDRSVAVAAGHQQYTSATNRTADLIFQVQVNRLNTFEVRAIQVGRVTMIIKLFRDEASRLSSEFPQTVSIIEYRVSVIRRMRTADLVFDAVIAAVAMLNIFSVGCSTDWDSLRTHLKRPSAVIIAACCQFIIMPMVALALAKALDVDPDLALGLFYVACVPGGGGGHIMVSVINGDKALSISINFVSTFISLGTAPLWIFAMGRFLVPAYTVFPLADFEMWLVVSAGSYSLGVFLKRISSASAEAFLNWLAKPVCLLFTLLYVTIGIYINMYIFSVLSSTVMVVAALLPVLGYLAGGIISYLSRQDTDCIKTTATETAISNCMLVLIMLRFSLPQPDADIASTIPMWVLFMSPVPFILAWFMQKFRRCINRQCAKRREKKYRHFSIVSSLLNVTNVTSLSTSIAPKVTSPRDQCPMFIDEKVTVL